MKKKLKQLCRKIKRAIFLIILAAGLSCTGYLLFVHRRVIRASIQGEPLPELPASHPCHGLLKHFHKAR